MDHGLKVLAIVPAYNEAASVGAVVARLLHVEIEGGRLDIVVVDDGSEDGTAEAVPMDSRVVVIRLPFNVGIGGAVQAGYRYAANRGYDVAVQVDADGQHPAEALPTLVAAVRQDGEETDSGGELVIGSRFLGVGDYVPSRPRQVGIGYLRGLLRCMTGLRLMDTTSGFRAANRRVIAMFAHWYPDDYPEPEVVLLLKRAGVRIVEVPVVMAERQGGRSSISDLRGVYYLIKVTLALVLDLVREPWPKVLRANDQEMHQVVDQVVDQPVDQQSAGEAAVKGTTS